MILPQRQMNPPTRHFPSFLRRNAAISQTKLDEHAEIGRGGAGAQENLRAVADGRRRAGRPKG